jgi:catechol 2,3-dioxygenase-like lactoylglutathione lyase family enzyme
MKNQRVYLEHANITVSNLAIAVKFFQTAFPDFEIRGGGEREGSDGLQWVHVGNDETYIALTQGSESDVNNHPDYDDRGINHIGFVVDNVEGLAERLELAGFKRNYPKQVQKFRIRDYFGDGDGNQYEFVEYLSEVPEERNSYVD